MDYSLGALSQHFCQTPLPELSAASLKKIRLERPRAYAQHVLRQAEASASIFDRLAYLYNFIATWRKIQEVPACPSHLALLSYFSPTPFLVAEDHETDFEEMARVTGCPLSYLLERGQAIKAGLRFQARKLRRILPPPPPLELHIVPLSPILA